MGPCFGTIVQRKPPAAKNSDILSIDSMPSPAANTELSLNTEPSYVYQHPLPLKIRRLFDNLQRDYSKDRVLRDSLEVLRVEVERLNDNYVNKIHELVQSEVDIRKLKAEITKIKSRRDRVKSKARRDRKKRPQHKSGDSTSYKKKSLLRRKVNVGREAR